MAGPERAKDARGRRESTEWFNEGERGLTDERTVVVVVTGEEQTRRGGDRKSDVKMPPSAP